MPRKRHNKVVRKNLAALRSSISRNVVQNVKVTVQQPRAKSRKAVVRRRNPRADKQPGELLPASNRTSQAPGISSVYNAPSPIGDRTLPAGAITSLIEALKGKSPEPATPSKGLTTDRTESPGLARYMMDRPPVDSPLPDLRRATTLTPATRLYTEKEKIRRWLLVNFRYIPPSGKYKMPQQQIDRVEQMKDVEALLKLYQLTKENMKAQGISEQIPAGLTPRDYEKENRQSLADAAAGGGGGGRRLDYDMDMNNTDDDDDINRLNRMSSEVVQELREGLSR